MEEDLERANLKFRELLEKSKTKVSVNKEMESLLYFFFLSGFKEGSGVTQLVQ